jgi:hypothetical protein
MRADGTAETQPKGTPMKMLTITTTDGAVVIGRPNYVDTDGAEIETITGEYVWLTNEQLGGMRVERAPDVAAVTDELGGLAA